MRHLFEEMREKGLRVDVATYTSVMNWLGKSGNFKGAIGMWMQMRRKGCKPTVVSYTALIKILFDNRKTKEASDTYREMLDAGVPPSCHTYTVLIEHLAGLGKCYFFLQRSSRFVHHLFDKMPHIELKKIPISFIFSGLLNAKLFKFEDT